MFWKTPSFRWILLLYLLVSMILVLGNLKFEFTCLFKSWLSKECCSHVKSPFVTVSAHFYVDLSANNGWFTREERSEQWRTDRQVWPAFTLLRLCFLYDKSKIFFLQTENSHLTSLLGHPLLSSLCYSCNIGSPPHTPILTLVQKSSRTFVLTWFDLHSELKF